MLRLLMCPAHIALHQLFLICAAAVPQDRRGPAGNGDDVGEVGGHGGREPEADFQPVQLAAAGGERMRLLEQCYLCTAHTLA